MFDPSSPVRFDESWGAWMISSYRDVRVVLRPGTSRVDVSQWARADNPSFAAPWAVDGLVWRDLRSLIDKPYRAPRMKRLELGALARVMVPRENKFEFVSRFARPFAVGSGALALGVPEMDVERACSWIEETSLAQDSQDFRVPLDGVGYFQELIQDRLRKPRGGLLDDLILAWRQGFRVGDRKLTEWEVVGFLWTHLIDSSDTLATQLGNTLLHKLTHGGPDRMGDLVEAALWANPAFPYLRRRLNRDVNLGAVRLPAGDDVMCWLPAANRDLSPDGRRHLSFGAAPRVCIGAALARRAIAAGVRAVLDAAQGLRGDHDDAGHATRGGLPGSPCRIRITEPPRYQLVLNNSLRELGLEFL